MNDRLRFDISNLTIHASDSMASIVDCMCAAYIVQHDWMPEVVHEHNPRPLHDRIYLRKSQYPYDKNLLTLKGASPEYIKRKAASWEEQFPGMKPDQAQVRWEPDAVGILLIVETMT